MHLPDLIQDLALILTVAGVMALLFRKFKQPTVLAYLIAGILVGPEVKILPSVVDRANVQIWADLGVIFLLFVLGLEFSFRKLLSVGRTSFVAATVEVVAMTSIGWCLGKLLHWSSIDALFLGGMLAISSTTIILKAFDELGVKNQHFASYVLGVLVIEDLFAILLLASLSTIAATRELQGMPLLKQAGALVAFLAVTMTLGNLFLSRILRRLRPLLNDELRVVISLALCLALVMASTSSGFSPALGAFLMGTLIGDTSEGERIERFLKPIRDFFGAIFFTSVGMLLNFESIENNPGLIFLITTVTIVGKVISTTGGMLLGGQSRKVSLQTGLSLAQIGEFSFIIGMLGLSLGVIRSDLYPLAVSVSLITTFTTPYLIYWAVHFRADVSKSPRKILKPQLWDGHLGEFEIHPHHSFAGRTLSEVGLREKFSVSIVAIHRGEHRIIAPGRGERIMPYDRVVVLGADEELIEVENFFKTERLVIDDSVESSYDLARINTDVFQEWVGKSLRESGIREKLDGLVLGIERDQQRILNPDPDFVIHEKDAIWVYGRRDLLRSNKYHS